MQNNEDLETDLIYALKTLEHISERLRHVSQVLIIITLFNLVVTMMAMSGMYRLFRAEALVLSFSMIPIIFGIFAVMFAFRFDSLRRDGDAYFEELSDELHGRKLKESNESYANDRSLKARVIIRRYSNASSIPLVPGKYGPASIAVINIIFSFLGALMSAKFY